MSKPDVFGPVLQRRECMLPTWRGWVLLMVACGGLLLMAALNVQPFLSLNKPQPAEILVVEGWLPDYALADAAAEFARGRYLKLYVTGGPLVQGSFLGEYKSYADLGAATLHKLGVSSDKIEAVPAAFVQKDRTVASAIALKQALLPQANAIKGFNLVSMGVHARRTQLLFSKVFGPHVQVGIIAVTDRSYAAASWWRSSQGVRMVIDELLAWLYAVLVYPFVGQQAGVLAVSDLEACKNMGSS